MVSLINAESFDLNVTGAIEIISSTNAISSLIFMITLLLMTSSTDTESCGLENTVFVIESSTVAESNAGLIVTTWMLSSTSTLSPLTIYTIIVMSSSTDTESCNIFPMLVRIKSSTVAESNSFLIIATWMLSPTSTLSPLTM